MEKLRERLPFADLSAFERDPQVQHLADLFTVDLISRYIQEKLAAAGEREQTAA